MSKTVETTKSVTQTSGLQFAVPRAAVAETEDINRTEFTKLSTRKFADFFNALSENMNASRLFDECTIPPTEVAAENDLLDQAKRNSMATQNNATTQNFAIAVTNAKTTCNTIADWTQQTYPRDEQVAAILGMRYNKKSGKLTPIVQDPVTGLKIVQEAQGITLKWKPLPNMSGRVLYEVYMTTEDNSTGTMVGSTTNSRAGVTIATKTAVIYYFYVVAKTSGGVGPQSDSVRWVGQ